MAEKDLTIAENKELIQQKALAISKTIDPGNPETLSNFGVETQRKLGHYSNELLSKVRAKDSGEAGTAINELLSQINMIKIDDPDEKRGFFSRLPFGKKLQDRAKRIASQYNSISDNVDDVVVKLEKTRQSILKDTTSLEVMFNQAVEYIHEIRAVIAAGKMKIEELDNETIPQLQAEVENSNQDELAVQRLSDMVAFKERLEKKVHDFTLSHTIATQSMPQIRMIQTANDVLAQKIQNSIVTVIPVWRQQVAIALGLEKQRKALEIQKKITDTTNEMLRKNSELLKKNVVITAQENERGIVDVDTLKKVNRDMVETLDQVIKISEEGSKKREEAVKELAAVQEELNSKIIGTFGKSKQIEVE
ncbi:toxic anion resistance protein [Pontibacter cellulosilyticus]|uniref:Toxic anion resistance protein n=1 Tax=Pontibacter cellulosilyticus TaxID=1720253 RepID=A0A923N217_9BACT|nr:toxic anion resistance protein [Pontibacter cellulosilyticus]MBC5991425.1 toxic anion resistance protein [Pontibacter cellulosilyticus]